MPMTLRSRSARAGDPPRAEDEAEQRLLGDEVDGEEEDFVVLPQKMAGKKDELSKEPKKGIEGDESNIAVLLFLYVLQVQF